MHESTAGRIAAIGRATGFLAVDDGKGTFSVVEVFTSIPLEQGWELAGELGSPGSKDLWVKRRNESINAIVQFTGLDLATAQRILENKA